jgi:hypothetical protein
LRRHVFKTRTFARWSRKERWFFLYGFARNERDSINHRELTALQMTAEALLGMDVQSLWGALEAGELTEICDEEEPHTY